MIIGIIAGLGGASFQDFGYILSRNFVLHGGRPGSLLIHSQILMGMASIPILFLLLIFSGMPESMDYLLPMAGVIIGSGGGQYFFFSAEKYMEASRISALMGGRVVLLALVSAFFLHIHFHILQWLAIFLAAGSAVLINWEDGEFRLAGMKELAGALTCYLISDLSIQHMVHGVGKNSLVFCSIYALCLVNIITAALLLPFGRKKWKADAFQSAEPFAGIWLLKQFCLYFCVALIGPVHANVVLAFRGPIAVLIAMIRHTKPVSVSNWIRRGCAALIMTVAVILYTLTV